MRLNSRNVTIQFQKICFFIHACFKYVGNTLKNTAKQILCFREHLIMRLAHFRKDVWLKLFLNLSKIHKMKTEKACININKIILFGVANSTII